MQYSDDTCGIVFDYVCSQWVRESRAKILPWLSMGSFIEPGRSFAIAVLNCGYTSPIIQKERGQYSDIFTALLLPAAEQVAQRQGLASLQLKVKGYDTVNEEYPSTLDDVDAIIVSGSPNSAFQDLSWIRRLDEYISCRYR